MSTYTIPAAAVGAKPRMAWVDNIRWTVIVMVVLVHACVTYSGLGSWYYKEPGVLDLGAKLVFWMYSIFSQAFFMGLLFFIAAAFVPASYDKKGFWRFIGERALRLGVPALIFMLVLGPITSTIASVGTGRFVSWPAALARYPKYITSGSFLGSTGPLWFAVALLVFSLAYALVRLVTPMAKPRAELTITSKMLNAAAAVIMTVIALGSFLVRLVQPVGTSWYNMQLCFFPSYVVLFLVGLWAGRRGLLTKIPRQAGMVWLKLAFIIGVPSWFLLLGLGGALTGSEQAFAGGMHWQAAGYAAWEAFFCVSISIGLVTLYHEKVNVRNAGTGLLADTSFGIYTFHAPILVGVSVLLRAFALYPLAKAVLVAAIAYGLTLGFTVAVRMVPGFRKIFS